MIQDWLGAVAQSIAVLVISAGLAQNAIQLVQLVLAGRALSEGRQEDEEALVWRRYADASPPVAVLAPAFNEEAGIVDSVRSLLSLHYPNFEVVIINDGSTDGTLARLIESFELKPVSRQYAQTLSHQSVHQIYAAENQPRLVVIDKVNGGKADALNVGINVSRAPLFCSMDADSMLEPDALLRAVRPFVENPEETIAVGGTVRIANGCRIANGQVQTLSLPRNLWALFQTVEYLRAFLMARLAWSRINALTIISGAFGLFRRDLVVEVGGYARGTVGEDMELVVRLHRRMREQGRRYRIAFVPEPVCWTEAPETLAGLCRQRARWQRGTLETFALHRSMTFDPKYGRLGSVAFPHLILVDIAGPPIELLGYALIPLFWATGLLSIEWLLAFLAVSFTFGIALSLGALALEEAELRRFPKVRHLIILTLAAVAENFGYRQLCNVWRLQGLVQFIRRDRTWGSQARRGLARAS